MKKAIIERLFQLGVKTILILLVPIIVSDEKAAYLFVFITTLALSSFVCGFQVFYHYTRLYGRTKNIIHLERLVIVSLILAILSGVPVSILSTKIINIKFSYDVYSLLLFYFALVTEVLAIELGRFRLNINGVSTYNWYEWGRNMVSLILAITTLRFIEEDLLTTVVPLAFIISNLSLNLLQIRKYSRKIFKRKMKISYIYKVISRSKEYNVGTLFSYLRLWLDRVLSLYLIGNNGVILSSIVSTATAGVLAFINAVFGQKISQKYLLEKAPPLKIVNANNKIIIKSSIVLIGLLAPTFFLYLDYINYDQVDSIDVLVPLIMGTATLVPLALSSSLQGLIIRNNLGKYTLKYDVLSFILYLSCWTIVSENIHLVFLPAFCFTWSNYFFKYACLKKYVL